MRTKTDIIGGIKASRDLAPARRSGAAASAVGDATGICGCTDERQPDTAANLT
jgi:hypothetical protein